VVLLRAGQSMERMPVVGRGEEEEEEVVVVGVEDPLMYELDKVGVGDVVEELLCAGVSGDFSGGCGG
jgi:hypothetical protein